MGSLEAWADMYLFNAASSGVSGTGRGGGETTRRIKLPVVEPRMKKRVAYMYGRRERLGFGGGGGGGGGGADVAGGVKGSTGCCVGG